MLKYKNIHMAVQAELVRKQRAIDRKNTETGKDFFVGNALEPQDRTNPIEQHLYRSCFAKVNVAVPDVENSTESVIVQKPLSLSSYMKRNENGIFQINEPVTFSQKHNESSDNRFKGHSGVTKISVAQKEYYTYEYTIGWVCPDPVFFDDIFEPSFLKLGAYCSIEFGWGINDKGIVVPDMTIEQMEKYLDPESGETIQDRNLQSPGNYYCNVGTVVNFNWAITEDGSYAGDIKVLSMGASPLLDGATQGVNNSADEIPAYKLQKTVLLSKEIQDAKKDKNSKIDKKELEEIEKENIKNLKTLLDGTVSFKSVMVNLEDVVKKYLGLDETSASKRAEVPKNNYGDNPYGFTDDPWGNASQYVQFAKKKRTDSLANTKFKNGALFIDSNDFQGTTPEKLKNRYFMSWGFFEDIILNSFFEMKSGDKIIQQIRSVGEQIGVVDENVPGLNVVGEIKEDGTAQTLSSIQPNRCKNNKFLYSMGLDSVILPGAPHPLLNQGFTEFTDSELKLAKAIYKPEQRHNFSRVHLMYKIIDEYYKPFAKSKDSKYGEIRNMVFPIQMFKRHFESTPSVRQGLRNFWAEVSGHYGGFWNFKVGQDQDITTRIGISDAHHSDVPDVSEPKNQTQEEDENGLIDGTALKNLGINPNKVFTFPVFGKQSIVKTFDVSLDLGAEAATIARYGTFSNPKKGLSSTNALKNLGIECWTILNNTKREQKEENAPTLERQKRIDKLANETLKDLSYASDDGKGKGYKDEYLKASKALMGINDEGLQWDSIEKIKDDLTKQRERIDNKLTKFYKGVGGIYDKSGNMSQFMKSTMNYLLTYNLDKGTGSLLQTVQAPIPVTISMELDGIGGFQVGNIFRVDYLPELYRKYCYFAMTKIDHNISTSGWTTSIDAMMMADMPHYLEDNPGQLNEYIEDYIELFKLTSIDLTDFGDGNFPEFDKLTEKFDKRKEQFEQLINLYNEASSLDRVEVASNKQLQNIIRKSLIVPSIWNYKSKSKVLRNIEASHQEFKSIFDELETYSDIELFRPVIQEKAFYRDVTARKLIDDVIADVESTREEQVGGGGGGGAG